MIEIPLKGGAANAHQRFSIQLGAHYLEFRLNYLARYGAWCADIYEGETLLIPGAMLEPNAELTANRQAGIGRLFFTGEQPTLDNLGITNSLVWVDA